MSVAVICGCLGSTLANQGPASRPDGDYREFTLTAAAPPTPLLKYRFDVDLGDSIDGNAAPLYLQALLVTRKPEESAALDKMFDEESDSDEELAKMAAERVPWLDTSVPILLVDANRRTHCFWDSPMRERTMETLLPYLNHLRQLANVLALKGRIAVTRGNIDDALELVRASIIMADRADDGGETFMVNELVSVGMYALSVERLTRVMNMPNCPNLYWAMRQLPVEFGNQAVAARSEGSWLFMVEPGFRPAREGDLSADEWRTLTARLREHIAGVLIRWPGSDEGRPAEIAARLTDQTIIDANDAAALPAAKAYYAKTRGLDDAAVSKIEASKLVSIWYFESFRAVTDEIASAFLLPYPQRLAKLRKTKQLLLDAAKQQPSNPFFILCEPADRFAVTNARADRMTAALVTVEAIRTYAAAHDNALPPTLEAIGDETPAIPNPTTRRPFDYRVDGDQAILSDDGAILGNGDKVASYPLEYVIRIRH